jgi:hypothetical protein
VFQSHPAQAFSRNRDKEKFTKIEHCGEKGHILAVLTLFFPVAMVIHSFQGKGRASLLEELPVSFSSFILL